MADRSTPITRTLERGNASRYLEIDDCEAVLADAAVVASLLPDDPVPDANHGPQTLCAATRFDVPEG